MVALRKEIEPNNEFMKISINIDKLTGFFDKFTMFFCKKNESGAFLA